MPQPKTDIQAQLAQLEEVVAWFERDDIDIQEAIARFEEGSRLAEDIKKQLAQLENKITVLKERFDQE